MQLVIHHLTISLFSFEPSSRDLYSYRGGVNGASVGNYRYQSSTNIPGVHSYFNDAFSSPGQGAGYGSSVSQWKVPPIFPQPPHNQPAVWAGYFGLLLDYLSRGEKYTEHLISLRLLDMLLHFLINGGPNQLPLPSTVVGLSGSASSSSTFGGTGFFSFSLPSSLRTCDPTSINQATSNPLLLAISGLTSTQFQLVTQLAALGGSEDKRATDGAWPVGMAVPDDIEEIVEEEEEEGA
ncbi:unnamed protein product, partial [Protopolystoma xenopodis]